MKAWAYRSYGPLDRLALIELPTPVPGPGQVQVRILAAAINRVDGVQRQGEFKALNPQTFPYIPGKDFSGVVTALGEGVDDLAVGDEVYGATFQLESGAFAETIAVDRNRVARKPKSLDHVAAASLPVALQTAWRGLVTYGELKRGERVLIHAGSGGVGSIAIQIAKELGATVIATTGSDNVSWVRELGADQVIDYRSQDFAKEVRDVDLVLDSIGGAVRRSSFSVLRPGGRLISINGTPNGAFALEQGLSIVARWALSLATFLDERAARKAGVTWRFLLNDGSGEELALLAEWIEGGRLKPIIDRVCDFDDGLEAFAYLEKGHARGKVVLKIQETSYVPA